jgi:hypothetical protein
LPGRDGLDGVDGVSVMDANIDFDGSLIISLSNGRVINVGEVVSQDLADKIQVISTMSTNTAIAAITGGTIDGTVIGGTTPAAGTFTTLRATGVATFAAGSVSLPSITTTGDVNTGVYFPAADTVGITAGGTQRGAFSSTGLAVTGAISSSTSFSTFSAISASLGLDGISVGTSTGVSARGNVIYRGTDALSAARVGYVGINVYGTDGSFEIKHGSSGAGITISSAGLVTAGASLAVTGVATFAAGTVALPSITTSGDTNTGIYFPAADTVGITNGGTERGRFTTTGFAVTGTASATGAITSGTTSTAGSIVISDNQNNGSNVLNTITSIGINANYSELAIKTRYNSTTVLSTPFYINSSRDIGLGGDITASALTGAVLVISGSTATERMRIDSSGNVLVGKSSATANGGDVQVSSGITFPATQVPKSDANTLDDYEEGTWTPNQGSGLTVVGAFSSVGNYVKIGRVVTVQGYLQGATSVSVATGFNILTSNLPFSCNTNQTPAYAGNNAATAFAGTYVNALTIGSIESIAATSVIYFFATYYTTT